MTDRLAVSVSPTPPILEVRDLRKYFPIRQDVFARTLGQVKALDGISFAVHMEEVLRLVGESRCGKTTAGRAVLQLMPPAIGSVTFESQELVGLPRRQMRRATPMSSLADNASAAGLRARSRRTKIGRAHV